jgi:pimeloyl-ACP methyl ester carboxylesterase
MSEDIIHSKVPSRATTGKYAPVNGLNLYYETYGGEHTMGTALIMLHGGLGTTRMFGQLPTVLGQDRRVIAVELQAHGHTADIDRPLSFEGMADDIAALIQHLGLEHADIFGYSLGGGVALQTTIRHPEVVRKLVLVSAPCKQDGWYPEVLAGMAQMSAEAARGWVGSPMQADYASAAPRPEDWPALADKLGQLLRQDYDWSRDVAEIKAPILIIVGDADSVRTAHAVEFFGLLGGGKQDAGWDGSGRPVSQLTILPGTTHYNAFVSPLLASIIPSFLDAPMPAAR